MEPITVVYITAGAVFATVMCLLYKMVLDTAEENVQKRLEEDWKQSIDIQSLISDKSLKAEAEVSVTKRFKKVLRHYNCACDELKVVPVVEIHNLKKVLEKYPKYLESNVSKEFEFKQTSFVYTYTDATKTRCYSLELELTPDLLQDMFTYNYDSRRNTVSTWT